MDIEQVLTERFVRAIKKSFRPCPLIGDKWFLFHADGKPADFQFVGCNKLAKAMGKNPRHVAQTIVKHLYISDINAAIEITQDAKINLKIHDKARGRKDEPASSD